jgi:hypothetical protein
MVVTNNFELQVSIVVVKSNPTKISTTSTLDFIDKAVIPSTTSNSHKNLLNENFSHCSNIIPHKKPIPIVMNIFSVLSFGMRIFLQLSFETFFLRKSLQVIAFSLVKGTSTCRGILILTNLYRKSKLKQTF